MADALVSPLLEQITTILSQQALEEVKLVVGVDKEIQKLNSNLLAVQAVLEDADRRQIKEAAVQDWLNKLKDVCYDMDDVLDEWSIAINKRRPDKEAENEPEPVPNKTVCSFFRLLCPCFGQVIQRHDIALKIKDVTERLDVIAKERAMYGFEMYRATEQPEQPSPTTTSFVDVSSTHGRKDDKKNVVCKLLGDSSRERGKLQTVSIVGTGGIGKTTLAQLANNDDEVKANFDKRMWVCVSDPFNEIRIAKAILEYLGGASPNLAELPSLLETISESIEGKKFLLVLDDVWTNDHKKWEPLKLALNHGAPGSKILVTTRKDEVANMIGSASLIRPSKLSDDDCWSIFSQLAFDGKSNDEHERLTEIGKKIAEKCKGLPLAAKVLGALMRSKRTRGEWENVLSSELWETKEVESGLFAPLLLSYNDLPAPIRQCFTYCTLLRKDYEFQKDELIQMWMAQGFLKRTPSKEMEVVGAEYFEILELRGFFQKSKDTFWSMHDIVHDSALILAKKRNFTVDVSDTSDPTVESYEKFRHLSISISNEAPFPMSILKAKHLRSLFINTENPSIGTALPTIFRNFKSLRTLNLMGYPVEEIPGEIGELIHLRYLNLAVCEKLRSLPETVSNLRNLQTLDLSGSGLKRLPQGIVKLTKLRHLVIERSGIDFMPKGIERLISLRTLSYFILCGGDENRNEAANLGEMKDMNHLGGHLSISDLGCVADVSEAVTAQLKSKKLLIGLTLDFCWGQTGLQGNEDALIEALQPPSGLETLYIYEYAGTLLPSWLKSLSMLRKLDFYICPNIEFLPPLGRLPYLEYLHSIGMKKVRKLDVAGFLGIETVEDDVDKGKSKQEEAAELTTLVTAAFPKLKELGISAMDDLEEWESYGIGSCCRVEELEKDLPKITIMPQLRSLEIVNCPKLKALPDYILAAPLLEYLEIGASPILRGHYYKEEEGTTGEDWHKISHIQTIQIDGKEIKKPPLNS